MDNWLVVDLPFWKLLVSWDYYSQYMETWQRFQTTNQIIYLTNDEWIGFRENLQETIDFEDFDIK